MSNTTPAGWALINPTDDPLELLRPNTGSQPDDPQTVMFCIVPENKTIYFDHCAQHETGIPGEVYYGRCIRIVAPTFVNAQNLTNSVLCGEYDDMLEILYDGFTEAYNRNGNLCGYLDEEARDALNIIEERLSYADILPETAGIYGASDWFAPLSDNEFPITADTTDEELRQIAEDEEEEARNEYIVLIDTFDYLQQKRDELAQRKSEGDE